MEWEKDPKSVVRYAQLAPAFNMIRALTLGSVAAALALAGASWDPRLVWTLVGLALVASADALYRRDHPDASPGPRLLFDAGIIIMTAVLLGGPALVAAPMAYLLTAALLVLPLRRALLVVAFVTACIVAVYFSAIPDADGRTQWALGMGALVVFLAALVVLLVAAARVIQEMRKRERALLEQALAASQAKSELLASVSHELRTPLSAVVGFAELLRDEAAQLSDKERVELIRAIAEQSFDLAGLVDDLLVAARHQIGELTVTSVRTDLRAQAAQVLESWGDNPARSIQLRGEAVPAQADPGRVRQILRNLIANAFRYGGSNIRIVLDGGEQWARVQVRDDGPAIPAESKDRIFGAYYRVPGDKHHPSSIGLGLAVSRDLARLMGGDLTYRHEDGESVFELALPRLQPTTPPVLSLATATPSADFAV